MPFRPSFRKQRLLASVVAFSLVSAAMPLRADEPPQSAAGAYLAAGVAAAESDFGPAAGYFECWQRSPGRSL